MKFLSSLLGCCLIATSGFTQIRSLQSASDKAQKKIEGTKTVTEYGFDKLALVNPFIGTGGHGHTYPGASAPFGMMQLSPDTRFDGWDGCSGYHYSDAIIYGFSHTHLSGTGVSDYGDLLIVPQSGSPKIDPGYSSEDGYGAHFSHENESASPGFYSVHLDEPNIDVRLTVSQRAGMHEYTFNNTSGKKFILIDLDHRDKLLSSEMIVEGNNTVMGHRTSQAWASRQEFYFYLQTDVDFQKARVMDKDGRHKLLLIFPKETQKVLLRVGMSAVDTDGAKANLNAEIPDFNFENVKTKVESAWNQELSKVLFKSTDKEVMTNFYTALYHSFLNPNVFSDVDRRYRGYDGQIHTLAEGEGDQYTVFSLWDTYRAAHPLFTLTQVGRTNDFIRTFLRHFDQGGTLPIWELAGNETGCMIGYHSVSVIADAYSKGIRGYDGKRALDAMIATSNRDELGKRIYAKQGFIGVGDEPESVSKTLEYAYNDFCIAEMIKYYHSNPDSENYTDRYYEYEKRSMNFVNVFDPETKFMRGRRSMNWFAPFKPEEVNFNYTEANSWQYSLYAPHAVGVLSDLIGGKDALEKWIDGLFTKTSELSGRHQVDITGLIGQYAHGNEPSHHMAYLYNYTDAPHKTSSYVDKILREMYHNAPDGLSGNEDCGQMSSWYVLSALGIYQIAPGRPYYDFGRPLMNDAMIQLESGKKLTIKAHNNSPKAKYIDKIVLNGVELCQRFIHHSQLAGGGKLEFYMTETPSKNYLSYYSAPTIEELPVDFVAVPHRSETDRVFEKSTTVTLSNIAGNDVMFTTDGSDPLTSKTVQSYSKVTENSKKPITIDKTTTVKAFAVDSVGHKSAVVSADLVKKNPDITINVLSTYANQYAAYGDMTVVDGIRGGTEYRTGDWQGYWAQDVVFEIVFKEPMHFNAVGLGCLEDTKSWIFLPTMFVVEGSQNGETYTPLGFNKLIHTAKEIQPSKVVDFWIEPEVKGPYKKIRITAVNYGKCPEWHLGAGNDTWLFVDEILFR